MVVQSKSIPKIKKCYQSEWLLFDVSKIDKQNRPFEGKLLAHSVNRNAVYEAWSKVRVNLPYLTYTGRRPKKGIVSVL